MMFEDISIVDYDCYEKYGKFYICYLSIMYTEYAIKFKFIRYYISL